MSHFRMSDKRLSGQKPRALSLSLAQSNPASSIPHLENLLKLKDETISELQQKLQDKEVLLQHRLQCMERLQRERDELRKKNSLLVGKNAELSRKQSVGSFAAPVTPLGRFVGRYMTQYVYIHTSIHFIP